MCQCRSMQGGCPFKVRHVRQQLCRWPQTQGIPRVTLCDGVEDGTCPCPRYRQLFATSAGVCPFHNTVAMADHGVGAAAAGERRCLGPTGDPALARQSPGSAHAAWIAGCRGAGFADGAAEIRTRGGKEPCRASTVTDKGRRSTVLTSAIYVGLPSRRRSTLAVAALATGCSPGNSCDASWRGLGAGRRSTTASSVF